MKGCGYPLGRGCRMQLPGFTLLSALAQSQVVTIVSPTDYQTDLLTPPLCHL